MAINKIKKNTGREIWGDSYHGINKFKLNKEIMKAKMEKKCC